MSKDPTPKADALRAMREDRYGHITARDAKPAIMQTKTVSAKEIVKKYPPSKPKGKK